MKHHYRDITDQLGKPRWWDEYGVPRYCEFTPHEGANIYASEIVLLEITCQNCQHPFAVAMSADSLDGKDALEAAVRKGNLHYGDPPNFGCCAAGPTMNSVPVRVIEFWKRGLHPERVAELERSIDCGWYDADPANETGAEAPSSTKETDS